MTTPLDRTGRDGLLARIAELEKELNEANRQLDDVFDRMGLHETGAPDTRGAAIIACWSSDVARIAALESGSEYAAMLENVTALQKRETEWTDETRALRRLLQLRWDSAREGNYVGHTIGTAQMAVLVDLLKTRWRGDAKYGGAEAHADLPLYVRPTAGGVTLTINRDGVALALDLLRSKKKETGNHSSWVDLLSEEVLELNLELLADEVSEERVEAEAIDVANVCLKMVEAIRIRCARESAK